jgi:uncharacterized protein YegL
MKKLYSFFLLLLMTHLQSCCFLGMGDCNEPEPIETDAVALTQVVSKTELPSKVTISFKADLREGQPLIGIKGENLKVYEDKELISSFESTPDIITKPSNFAFSTILLLDLSGSILGNNSLPSLKQASKSFVNSLFQNSSNGSYEMAIYWFDGEANIHQLKNFTSDKTSLIQAIESITENISRDNSTNLNGAIVQGINLMKNRIVSIKTPQRSTAAGSLVVFTDGTDQASRVPESTALQEVKSATDELSIFTIGLGGEINKSTLLKLGREGAEFADGTSNLTSTFDKLSKRVLDESNSYYVFQYCSPKRNGLHELKLEILINNKQGSVTKQFSANGFTGGCKVDK